MTDSEQAQLASVLSVDAKYLADCVDQFRAVGEVRIPVTSAEVLLANYQLAIKALGGAAGEEPKAIEHPSLRGVADLKVARDEAAKQMTTASEMVRSVLGYSTPGGSGT